MSTFYFISFVKFVQQFVDNLVAKMCNSDESVAKFPILKYSLTDLASTCNTGNLSKILTKSLQWMKYGQRSNASQFNPRIFKILFKFIQVFLKILSKFHRKIHLLARFCYQWKESFVLSTMLICSLELRKKYFSKANHDD